MPSRNWHPNLAPQSASSLVSRSQAHLKSFASFNSRQTCPKCLWRPIFSVTFCCLVYLWEPPRLAEAKSLIQCFLNWLHPAFHTCPFFPMQMSQNPLPNSTHRAARQRWSVMGPLRFELLFCWLVAIYAFYLFYFNPSILTLLIIIYYLYTFTLNFLKIWLLKWTDRYMSS